MVDAAGGVPLGPRRFSELRPVSLLAAPTPLRWPMNINTKSYEDIEAMKPERLMVLLIIAEGSSDTALVPEILNSERSEKVDS